jgi:hypothetical protein
VAGGPRRWKVPKPRDSGLGRGGGGRGDGGRPDVQVIEVLGIFHCAAQQELAMGEPTHVPDTQLLQVRDVSSAYAMFSAIPGGRPNLVRTVTTSLCTRANEAAEIGIASGTGRFGVN